MRKKHSISAGVSRITSQKRKNSGETNYLTIKSDDDDRDGEGDSYDEY